MKHNPEKINPYFLGLFTLAERFVWDIQPESWRSRARLKRMKNSHSGKKAVIICNGPSLLRTDFKLLEDVFTFGLNKINILFDKTDFRPSCIVAVNHLVIEQNYNYFNQTDIPLYIDSKGKKFVKNRENVTFLHNSSARAKFAMDSSLSIYQGYTVTFVAMQLAYHFGFKEVAVIGCDHNFASKGPANKTVVSGKEDVDHFDPNYFAGGVKWQLPDLVQSEISYLLAKSAYEENDRKIWNATDGGKLEVFPRIGLSEFIKKI